MTARVWITPRRRVDLCSDMGIEMGIKREQQIKKKKKGYRERERKRESERVYVKEVVERNNKKIEKIDYLNKIGGRIDKLIWSILRNGYVK